jgi:hypothetical protein
MPTRTPILDGAAVDANVLRLPQCQVLRRRRQPHLSRHLPHMKHPPSLRQKTSPRRPSGPEKPLSAIVRLSCYLKLIMKKNCSYLQWTQPLRCHRWTRRHRRRHEYRRRRQSHRLFLRSNSRLPRHGQSLRRLPPFYRLCPQSASRHLLTLRRPLLLCPHRLYRLYSRICRLPPCYRLCPQSVSRHLFIHRRHHLHLLLRLHSRIYRLPLYSELRQHLHRSRSYQPLGGRFCVVNAAVMPMTSPIDIVLSAILKKTATRPITTTCNVYAMYECHE